MSARFHPYLCGRNAAEWLIDMILYFSGTGNSKYAARRIADALGEPLLSLNDRIKSGDTLGAIARRYRVTTAQLMRWNGIKNAHKLRLGQRIRIEGR